MSTPASQTPSFSRVETTRPRGSPIRSIDRRSDGSSRFKGCAPYSSYEILSKLGEGTFGKVYKARSRKTGALLALKEILMHEEKEGFPITALREIKLLKRLHHPNVLLLEEMSLERRSGKNTQVKYMVTPYMDHDLSGLLENPTVHLNDPIIKCYMLQLLEGVRYLHAQQILHRDLKTANLLINNRGILQIADFGLARPYFEEPPQAGKGNGEGRQGYTPLVVTRWYRPPELLLGLKTYTPAIDLWGVGCILGEMYRRKPIMAGNSELNQAQLVFELVGAPNETNMPGWQELPGVDGFKNFGNKGGTMTDVFKSQGPLFLSLMSELLRLDWRKRTNAIDALKHPWFSTIPFPCKPGEIPRFEESHELDQRRFRDRERAALPPAPRGGIVGQGGDRRDGWMNGGHYDGHGAGAPRNHRGPPPGQPNRSWVPPDTRLPPRPPASRVPDRFDNHHNDRRPPRHDRDSYQPPANADSYVPDYGEPLPPSRNDRRDDPARRPERTDDRPRQQDRPRDIGYDGARDRYDGGRDRDRPRDSERDRDREIDRYRTPAAGGSHDNRERYVPARRRSRSPRR